MNNRVLKHLEALQPGSLICVEWCDASTGKSLAACDIDVPVHSWGIFIGLLGRRHKHVVVCQNSFHYTDDVRDVDFTAIPVLWTMNVQVIAPDAIPREEATLLLNSFLKGRCRTLKRRTANHGS